MCVVDGENNELKYLRWHQKVFRPLLIISFSNIVYYNVLAFKTFDSDIYNDTEGLNLMGCKRTFSIN